MEEFAHKATWLQLALNATEDIVFVKDLAFKFQACNRKCCEFLGASFEEIIGSSDEDFFPPETMAEFREIDSEIIKTGSSKTIEEWLDFPDGSRRLLETVKAPCYSDGGDIIGLMGISRDITERKQNEIELEKARDEAQKANRSKSRFLSNISHEIRTPLNAVLGFTQILKGMETDSSREFYLDSILSSGNLLLKLLNDILDLSKVEAGKLQLECGSADMKTLIDNVSNIFNGQITEKRLNYNVELTGFSKDLIIDSNRLSQILMNLISNALKFTHEGSINVTGFCRFLNERDNLAEVTISVKDTGIGIDPEEHQDIFAAFHQAEGQKVTEYGGTGLGLSIVNQLAGLMNGTVEVISQKNQGAEFILTLKDVEIASKEDPVLTAIFEEDPGIVLMAGELDCNRKFIKKLLARFGLKVVECSSTAGIKSAISVMKPGVLLVDVKPPNVTEVIQLCHWLNSIAEFRDIKVIPMAAVISEKDELALREAAGGRLIIKPLTERKVIEQLQKS